MGSNHWIYKTTGRAPLPRWAGWAFYIAMYGIPYGLLGLVVLLD